jgi:hypothetical protein
VWLLDSISYSLDSAESQAEISVLFSPSFKSLAPPVPSCQPQGALVTLNDGVVPFFAIRKNHFVGFVQLVCPIAGLRSSGTSYAQSFSSVVK